MNWLSTGLVATLPFVFGAGVTVGLWAGDTRLAKQRDEYNAALIYVTRQAIKDREAFDTKVSQLTADLTAVQTENAAAAKVIADRVKVYVNTPNASSCGLDSAGVQLHDASASTPRSKGADPRGVLGADPQIGASGGSTAGAVVGVTTRNNGRYWSLVAQYESLLKFTAALPCVADLPSKEKI